jgi:hypothetical protein
MNDGRRVQGVPLTGVVRYDIDVPDEMTLARTTTSFVAGYPS